MKTFLLLSALIPLLFSVDQFWKESPELKITWFGQASFLVTLPNNTQIILDPCGIEGYEIPSDIKADLVTVSHNHFDHNAVGHLTGKPEVIYGLSPEGEPPYQPFVPVDQTFQGIRVYDVESNHFPKDESPQLNAIFVFDIDGVRLVHLGDLGRTLTDDQIKQIGKVDILMIPVGGKYTIYGAKADSLVAQLKPTTAVIPMHFKTKIADFLPYTADDFVAGKENVEHVPQNSYTFDMSKKPDKFKYIVFDYFN